MVRRCEVHSELIRWRPSRSMFYVSNVFALFLYEELSFLLKRHDDDRYISEMIELTYFMKFCKTFKAFFY